MAALAADELEAEMAAFLTDPSTFPDPYPFFSRIRAAEPVHRSRLGLWVVTSFAEGNEVFRSSDYTRAEAAEAQFRPFADGASPEAQEAVATYATAVLFQDPPDHTRLRRLISRVFTPRAIEAWRARVEEVVDRLVTVTLARGEVDFVTDMAYALPEAVACELLGVPLEDHDRWSVWTTALTQPAVYTRGTGDGADPATAARDATRDALVGFRRYFNELVEKRKDAPTEGRTDLLSLLLEAEDEGDRLNRTELIGTLIILILAGHHTTANLIGNGMLALLRHPGQLDLLRERPELVPNAVEELLRYDGPGRSMPRVASRTMALGPVTVEQGEAVTVILNAANRDPKRFEDPDRLDVTRSDVGHLGFGAGLHFCLGAALARLEATVAFSEITRRMTRITLLDETITWRPSYIRGLAALPLRCEA